MDCERIAQPPGLKQPTPTNNRFKTLEEDSDEEDKTFDEPKADQISCLEDQERVLKSVICEVADKASRDGSKWELVEAAVDSAAVDSVSPKRALPHIETNPFPRSISGRPYIAANNNEIKNHGQRKIAFWTDEGLHKNIIFQSADVGRWLISVDRLNESGCTVILSKKSPRITTKNSETIKFIKKGGVFVMRMWVKVPDKSSGPFARPGR